MREAGWVRPLVAEALGYVGGALALLATAILVQRFWGDLPAWGRVTLLAATAAGLVTAGVLVGVRDGPLDRLRGFLWLLSAVAVGGSVSVGLVEYTGLGDTELMLATGTAVTVYGLILWLVRRAGLQQLVVFAAALTAVTAGGTDGRPDTAPTSPEHRRRSRREADTGPPGMTRRARR